MEKNGTMSVIMASAGRLPDRRKTRTRRAIIHAFSTLMFERRYDEFGVADIAEAANVGRSTFYEHFSGKDVLLREAMRPMLAVLAAAAAGTPDRPRLTAVTEHFWQNRRMARIVFATPMRALVERQLANAIAEKLGAQNPGQRLAAVQAAVAQIAAFDAWTSGAIGASLEEMVNAIVKTSGLATVQ